MTLFGHKSAVLIATLSLAFLPALSAETAHHHGRPQATPKAEAAKVELPANPRDLIKKAIDDQLQNTTRHEYSTWKEKDVKPRGTSVRQLVETPDGVLARYIEKDGHPLTADEKQKEDARVDRLLDPDQMRQKAKEQKEDEERTVKMLKAIPDAFIYKYGEKSTAPNGDTLVNVTFTPNPDFNPPSRESLVFQGMQGDMVVDANAMQLVKIDGTLFRDVNIGWGIIGHLDKGGRFLVEQQEVYKNHWDQTHMVLDFTGKALIFKTIKIKEDSTAWDFQPVEKMDVKSALAFLKHKEGETGAGTAEASK